MKKFKTIIILVIVLVIYAGIMFFLFRKDSSTNNTNSDINIENNTVKNRENAYLVLGNNPYKYNYYRNKFIKGRYSEIENLNSLNIYVNNKYFGKYKMDYIDGWNLLNDKVEFVKYTGILMAGSDNLQLNVRDIKIREINNDDKMLLVNKYNISSFSNLTNNEVVDIDLDNNGIMDEIICVSSKEYSDNNNYFDIVLVKLNDQLFEIVNNNKDDNSFYTIMSVFNYFDNKYDTIYVSKNIGIISEKQTYEDYLISYKNQKYSID